MAFLSELPIGLEREDLRVIHAAWRDAEITVARSLPIGSVRERYDVWEKEARRLAREGELAQQMAAELERWEHGLEHAHIEPPFMHALAEYEAGKQMMNPLKVLTSGVERKGQKAFYSSGKWRFVDRIQWWDTYDDDVPVVIGHYWRRVNKIDRTAVGKGDPDLFENTHPFAWHGLKRNVFCVDFSAGGRWTERKSRGPVGKDFKLGALRWPERTLIFDDGNKVISTGFQLN